MPKKTFYNLTEAKQDHLIKVAIEEFSTHGFNEVKIASIIHKADIPRSSFYDYFINKKDIYLYIIKKIGIKKQLYFSEINESLTFFDHLLAYLEASVRFVALEPAYNKIGKLLYNDPKLIKELFGEPSGDENDVFKSMIVKGVEDGVIKKDVDVEFVTQTLRILTSQLMIKTMNEKDVAIDDAIKSLSNQMISFIKNGISA